MSDLNLDDLERPERPKPMTITLGGQDYVLVDIVDVDHRIMLEAMRDEVEHNDSRGVIRCVVPEANHSAFYANKLEMWRMGALSKAYQEHYGMNAGEVSASPPS